MACSLCDGQRQIVAREIANELGQMLGPRYHKRDNTRVNQHGAKGTVKWSPTAAEVASGITQQKTLVDWSSPDGDAHWVTVEFGRIEAGGGGSFPRGFEVATMVTALPSLNTLPVQSTSGFPSSGTFAHKSAATGVVTTGVAYTGITSTLFTGLGGAFLATVAVGDTIFIPYSYRGQAQIVIGQSSVMEDPFYLDINRGQRFTCTARFVGVTLQMTAPPTGYTGGSLSAYAGLGHGVCPSLAPSVFTKYVDSLAANGYTNVVVPPKANFLLPMRSSDVNNIAQLDFLDNAGVLIDSLQFTNGGMLTPAPMSDDIYSINVRNLGASTANYRCVFQISV